MELNYIKIKFARDISHYCSSSLINFDRSHVDQHPLTNASLFY